MDDRTLLEKAAKAAGIDSDEFVKWRKNRGVDWNPLADDGDALRLAVKLGLDVTSLQAGISWDSADRYEATRRAIVRAAAAMADKGE